MRSYKQKVKDSLMTIRDALTQDGKSISQCWNDLSWLKKIDYDRDEYIRLATGQGDLLKAKSTIESRIKKFNIYLKELNTLKIEVDKAPTNRPIEESTKKEMQEEIPLIKKQCEDMVRFLTELLQKVKSRA